MSQHVLRLDLSVEELGMAEVADVGFRYDCDDEITDSPLRFSEAFKILACRLVDGLFLGSDGILCAVSDGWIVDSRFLLKGEHLFVISEVRHFVLDEADKVMNNFFVVEGDLVESFRKHLRDLDNVRVGWLARDGLNL